MDNIPDDLKEEIRSFLLKAVQNGRNVALDLDISTFGEANDTVLGNAVHAIAKKSQLGRYQPKDIDVSDVLPKTITFPYSRHASYPELCDLVAAFKPRDVWPCTVSPADWIKDGTSTDCPARDPTHAANILKELPSVTCSGHIALALSFGMTCSCSPSWTRTMRVRVRMTLNPPAACLKSPYGNKTKRKREITVAKPWVHQQVALREGRLAHRELLLTLLGLKIASTGAKSEVTTSTGQLQESRTSLRPLKSRSGRLKCA